MAKIKITCDSTCDLPAEQCKKFDIRVLPLGVGFGTEIYRDGETITAEEIFKHVREYGDLPKTSAISIGEYADVFRSYTAKGYSVIHINLSGDLSTCYQNACLAAQEVGNVYPIDSRNLSTGSGLLALRAAELAAEGYEAMQIVDILEEAKTRIDTSFVLQTLEYLKKGGRCSSIAAFGANVLKIRPEICVADGTMGLGRKYRGNVRKSITDYVRDKLTGRDDIDTGRIFVTHSQVDPAIIDDIAALVKELQPFGEVIVATAGCTISSHCGPECFGVLFFRKKDK